ncbi:AEC family transporter [Caldichromatium japonicum]|uniref:AEC family transporter n=1 Tax=Caldichromatium japonicum TaxID=2699430 RepID=A0A6G7VEK8_9GAMM|nr:AEC family transporter [Caldichromatium japonicum]QIK38513.1 AEC family transporter [Caldichromatium japonicum]
MYAILSVTAPIFILIALAFVAVHARWIPREGALALGRYALLFALPALLFNTLSKRPLAELVVMDFLTVYAGTSLLVYGLGILIASLIRRSAPAANAFYGLGVSMSNSSYIGYPLVAQLLGEPALVAVVMAILTEVLLILPITLILAEFAQARAQGGPWRTLGKVLWTVGMNPIVLAIGAGILFAAFDWRLPIALGRTLDMLAGSAAVVALFAIGGGLASQRVQGSVGPALAVAAGKLIGHPLVALGMLSLVPQLDPVLRQAALILAGLPMVTLYPLLAQRYGQGETAATALVLATLLAFFTLNLELALFVRPA